MLGLWPLIFALSVFASSKEEVLKHLGEFAYEVEYFDSSRFTKIHLGEGETERMIKDADYAKAYRRYLAYGAKAQIEENGQNVLRSLASVAPVPSLSFSVPQRLGLVAFKRGDLQASCSQIVAKAKELGMKSIAYYHPVHFSGGNGKDYRMPEAPVYGKHWRYEIALHFSQSEFESCMDLVSKAGLGLHYVPHLESVAALVGLVDEEWRMLSGIPIDNWYFHHSFGPLLTYLKKHPQRFRSGGSLEITLAAEIDPMVIAHAKKTRAGKAWLEVKLTELGVKGTRYFINTNGDFHHGKDLISKSSLQCDQVETLFQEIDGLAPSMYGDKGHLKMEKEKLDLGATLTAYRDSLSEHLASLCPERKSGLQKIVQATKIGFGEFAVDEKDPRQSYQDILKEADKSLLFIQYWSYGKWDHLGVLTSGDERLKSQLLKR